MAHDTWAILKEGHPVCEVFPGGRVPILNILLADQARLVERDKPDRVADVYWLDLDRVTPEQFEKLAALLVKLRGWPRADLEAQIARDRRHAIPVRADQCSSVSAGRSGLALIL